MAHTILIFSIAMGADYTSELISIVHWVPAFFMHNKIFLGSVTFTHNHMHASRKLNLESLSNIEPSSFPYNFFDSDGRYMRTEIQFLC